MGTRLTSHIALTLAAGLAFPHSASAGDTKIGSAVADVLTGGYEDSVVQGGQGDDTLRGDPDSTSLPSGKILRPTAGHSTSQVIAGSFGPPDRLGITAMVAGEVHISGHEVEYSGEGRTPLTGVGSGSPVLTTVDDLVYSPDKTKLALVTVSKINGVGNGIRQIVLKDLTTGVYRHISVNSSDPTELGNGESWFPTFSPDGKKLAFVSNATNLIPNDTNLDPNIPNSGCDTFVVDLDDPTSIASASTSADGVQMRGARFRPAFSPDGSLIALTSAVAGKQPTLIVRQLGPAINGRLSGTHVLSVPESSTGRQPFSPDGREIVFSTHTSGLDPGNQDNASARDIFVFTLADNAASGKPPGTHRLVTVGQASGLSLVPTFSPDGTKIAFSTNSPELVPGTASQQVVVKELISDKLNVLSTGPNGLGDAGSVTGFNSVLKFRADGKFIMFESLASNLTVGDSNGTHDLFIRSFSTSPSGKDLLTGGPGNDRLIGGPGDDTAVYAGPRKRYMITPAAGKPGVTQVADMLSGAGSDGTDALEGVEFLQFSDGTVPVDNPGPNNAGPTPKAIGFTVAPGGAAGPLALQTVDPEGDAITYAIGSQPGLGAATVSAAGGLTYVAGQNAGTDTFVVKATDAFGAAGDVTVTVTVVSAPAGTDGPDLLFGGPGADTIAGQGGDDSVSGDLGNDSLKGGGGGDSLSGGPGNDSLDGGTGDDIMNGGPGDDSFVVDSAGDVVIEKLNEGRDSVSASVTFALPDNVEALALAGNAPIGGTGNALANTLTGNGGANTLAGGGGNDRLEGGPGKDKLDGGDGFDTAAYAGSKAAVSVNLAKKTATGGDAAGDTLVSIEGLVGSPFADTLVGTAGANVIEGGGGADRLTGGKGADRYVYRAAGHSTPRKPDTIFGFKASEGDRIDLSAIDAVPGTAKNDAFAWIGSKRFSRKKGQLRFAGGALQADLNGDGKADLRIVLDRVTSLPRSATIR